MAGAWFLLGVMAPLTPSFGPIPVRDFLRFAVLPIAVMCAFSATVKSSPLRWVMLLATMGVLLGTLLLAFDEGVA